MRQAQIAHARIRLMRAPNQFVFSTFPDALRESWETAESVTRYRREWNLTAPSEVRPGIWGGEIGFEREGSLSRLYFNTETRKFHHEALSSGVAVPFIIDIDQGMVSFQITPPTIRVMSVTTNLQALLNQPELFRWSITPLSATALPNYQAWRDTVHYVTKFEARQLHPPNPSYVGRELLGHIMEEVDVEAMSLILQNKQGINDEADIAAQILLHSEMGYGTVTATGPDKESGRLTTLKMKIDYIIDRIRTTHKTIDHNTLADKQAQLEEYKPTQLEEKTSLGGQT